MIDCPICHVKNNDDARFCLECGQRLGGQAGPSGMPPEAAQQRPVQQQPPLSQPQPQQPPPQSQPPEQPRQKLRSPMLDDSDDEPMPQGGGGYGAPQQSPGEVNRLRQMSSRQQDPPNAPDRQFKNPYDPRNAPPEAQAPAHPPEQHQRKLRSPLLSGEEFDEEFPDDPAQSGSRSGAGLRSPLLGGGEGGGGGGLRSPMLGGGGGAKQQPQYDEYDDEPQGGGGSLTGIGF